MADNPVLTVQLLGGFRIAAQRGEAAGLDQPRLQRLLTYLMLHRRAPRTRQQIAFTLWPDTPDEQALNRAVLGKAAANAGDSPTSNAATPPLLLLLDDVQ